MQPIGSIVSLNRWLCLTCTGYSLLGSRSYGMCLFMAQCQAKAARRQDNVGSTVTCMSCQNWPALWAAGCLTIQHAKLKGHRGSHASSHALYIAVYTASGLGTGLPTQQHMRAYCHAYGVARSSSALTLDTHLPRLCHGRHASFLASA